MASYGTRLEELAAFRKQAGRDNPPSKTPSELCYTSKETAHVQQKFSGRL